MNEECPVGCCPHDTDSPCTGCPDDLPGAPLTERAAHLYDCQMLSTYKIAAVTGFNRRYISQLLHRAGIQVMPSGGGGRTPRRTAEDDLRDQLMAGLYQEHRMPSTQIAEIAGISEYAVLSPAARLGRANPHSRPE